MSRRQSLVAGITTVLALPLAEDAYAQCAPVDQVVTCDTQVTGPTSSGVQVRSDHSDYTCTNTNYPGSEKTYQFQPPAGTEVGLYMWVPNSTASDLDLIVQRGGCGTSNGTCVDDSRNGSATPENIEFIADGGVYYITVDDKKAINAGFELNITCPTPCTPATQATTKITCSSDFTGSTAGGTDVLDYYTCGDPWVPQPQLNNEVIYEFTPQVTGSVTFTLDGITTDIDLYVLDSTCDPTGNSCLEGSTKAQTASESLTFNATAGQKYYIVVEDFTGKGSGKYDLHFDDGAGGCREDCDDKLDNDSDAKIDCADTDCINDPACATCVDSDLDGHKAKSCGGTDCNDANAAIYPGATETCDNVDQDCDGVIDDGLAVTWYKDGDSDTYGTGSTTLSQCSQPTGYVSNKLDCNDANATIRPGGTEVCNDLDDDCDNAIDDNPTNPASWYADADNDQYGDATKLTLACDAPAGTVADKTDCNDAAASVFPGATEVCDGLDNDCDGAIDDNPVGLGTWYPDTDADGFGVTTGSVQQCARPTGYVSNNTDCNDTKNTIYPGATETCNNVDDDCDKSVDDNAVGQSTFYDDDDKDTYGDPLAPRTACFAPSGTVTDKTDCDDTDGTVHPGAVEVPYDNVDQDCVAGDLTDVDGDGHKGGPGGADCADGMATVHPGVTEGANGMDDDCDGVVDETTDWFDDDGDGFTEEGGDCDDDDIVVSPAGSEETACDGVDDDCDGAVDEGTPCEDDDLDGKTELEGDCADDDASINIGGTEVLGNGIDDDCDGVVDTVSYDPDEDGYDQTGGDCDQTDGDVFPGQIELANGVDDDCDGTVDEGTTAYDDDGDGYAEDEGDCWDDDATVNPAGTEDGGNGVDDNCDGRVDEGSDRTDDDFDGLSEEGGDCDDGNADVHPGADDVANGDDDDCDGQIDEGGDEDGDGYSVDDGDCNDREGWAHPNAAEQCDDIDNNCDGTIDEGCDGDTGLVIENGKCGCQTGTMGSGALLLGALATLFRRRRAA